MNRDELNDALNKVLAKYIGKKIDVITKAHLKNELTKAITLLCKPD